MRQQSRAGSGLSKDTEDFLVSVVKSNRNLSRRALDEIKDSAARGDPRWLDNFASGRSTLATPASTSATWQAVPRPTARATGGGGAGGRGPSAGAAAGPGSLGAARAAPRGRRTLDTIRMDTSDYQEAQPPPSAPLIDRDAEKARLALINERGRDAAARLQQDRRDTVDSIRDGTHHRVAAAGRAAPPPDPKAQLVDQLVSEIKGRADFLEEMRSQGKRAQYERGVAAEISQRMAMLKQLGALSGGGGA